MIKISTLMMLIASLGPGGHEAEIDSLQYKSTAAVQFVWKAQWETAKLSAGTDNRKRVLRVETPPNRKTPSERLTFDRKLKKSLSGLDKFQVEIKLLTPASGERLSLYFHSGKGWYTASASIHSNEWTQLNFAKSNFRQEDSPAGWDQVDGIRLSLWKGENKHPKFLLRNLEARSNLIAIIVPDDDNMQDQTAFQVADTFESLFSSVHINIDRITESSLTANGLGQRKLAILPHNPKLSKQGCDVLNRYLNRGGKLFVCYHLPPAISSNLGIKQGTYYRPGKDEPKLTSLQFNENKIDGLPKTIRQNSWNITTGEPIGYGAQTLAYWLDESGKNTNKSALVMSDRGVYFSHIPLKDDPENMAMMIISLLGKLEPRLWREIVFHALENSKQIGDCKTEQQLRQRIQTARGKFGLEELKSAEHELEKVSSLLKSRNGHQALASVQRYRKIREQAYLKGMPSKPREARAFWEHAGTGAYPGDWERSMKELSEAGFNMILPNMLWGDAAHYASDVLPRSATFEKYGDQIEQCLAAAKKYDIEVHVWKVNFRGFHHGSKEFMAQMKKEGRLQVDYLGVEQPWLNPAHPKNRELELNAMLEVVRKYDVAGIHFDYIRYPNSQMSFDNFSRELFEKERNRKVKNWPLDCYRGGSLEKEYTDFRCEQITKLVEAVSREARKIKPQIKISAAVFRDYPGCRESVAQDWPLWAKNGYLDFLCPMDYTGNDEQFAAWIKKQKELVGGNCLIYPGIGASSSRTTLSADRVAGQIHITRESGADGYTVFNFNEATANRVLPGLKLGAGKTKAIPPHQN